MNARRPFAPTLALFLLSCAPVLGQLAAGGGELLRQGVAPLAGSPQVDDRLGTALAAGDFDHDGHADLAIGIPGETVGASGDAGLVSIVYGVDGGLAAGLVESFDADDFAALGFAAENGDRFGSALASGDFDDDGYHDLAIAAPQKLVTRADLSTHAAAGVVFVLYGSPSGLAVAGQQVWHQGRNGLAGVAELDDRLGEALAAGDVDGDGRDDLAIGAPFEDVGAVVDAGGVNLLYGAAGGLTATSHVNLVWTQDTFGLSIGDDDQFGSVLALGDFAADGAADLAIGAPDEDLTGAASGGLVVVAQGLPGSGLSASDAKILTQADILLPDEPDAGDRFGAALVADDFDGDGDDDLAIGSPGEGWSDGGPVLAEVGAVDVLRGGPGAGLGSNGFGVRVDRVETGVPAALDSFGARLASGDFDADGVAELVIGAPGAVVAGADGAGASYLVTRPATQPFTSSLPLSRDGAAPGTPAAFDGFGSSLAIGDFDGNHFLDLAVGVPFADAAGPLGNAGAVNVFFSISLFRDDFESGTHSLWSTVVTD
jgi:hypothetical protein